MKSFSHIRDHKNFIDSAARYATAKNSFSEEETEQSVHERFEKQVRLHSSSTAVKCKGVSTTYEMLNKTANAIARAILYDCKIEKNSRIALYFGHNTSAIAAMIGVLKSGMTYVPVDPSYPPEQISYILEDSQPSLILTENSIFDLDKKLRRIRYQTLIINKIDTERSEDNIELEVSPDAAAYILYTSGSTGKPKGVIQTHRNLLRFIRSYTNSLGITSDDRLSLLPSFSFSASLMDIYGALLNGASVYPFNVREEGLSRLADWLTSENITVYHSVPTLFRHLVGSIAENKVFPEVRLIDLGGEPIYKRDVALFKKHFPSHCVLVNHMAFTEASVAAQYFIDYSSEVVGNKVPSGYAAEGVEISLINKEGREVEPGEIGEIILKSKYLSPGYWKKPELTLSSFGRCADETGLRIYKTGDLGRILPNGCIEHIGRKDFQIKVRGYTVQPSEIETALLEIAGVNQAVVIGKEYVYQNQHDKNAANAGTANTMISQRLVAYLAVDRKVLPPTKEIREYIRSRLPHYMVPSVFVILDALPLTATGKVDRRNLPEPDICRSDDTEFMPARNEIEATITSICEEILNIGPVGIKDNFYDLGIDSILYFHLILEAEKRIGKRLPTDKPFKAQTAEELACLFWSETLVDNKFTDETPSSTPIRHVYNVPSAYRKSRFRPWKPVRNAVFKAGARFLSYKDGIRFISWYCSQQWTWAMFFRRQVNLIRTFLSCINSPAKEADVIQVSLMINLFRDWIYSALARSKPEDFENWVRIKGIEIFQDSYKKGRGVVLVMNHSGLGYLTPLYLMRHGYSIDNMLVIGNNPKRIRFINPEASEKLITTVKDFDEFFFQQMSRAKNTLEQGGIVFIAGDGPRGRSSIPLVFHGRIKTFRAGFATLSTLCSADAIPTSVSLDKKGYITIEFLESLNKSIPAIDQGGLIPFLVSKYAAILEKQWQQNPGNIMLNTIGRFLALRESETT